MKQNLLSTTALSLSSFAVASLGTGVAPAQASDGIKLEVGGFFDTAYQVNFDEHGEGDLGNEHNTDGVFNSAEIWFDGEVALDNGLTAGVHIELEGETSSDQIDESYAYFSGRYGQLRAGSFDDALEEMCVTPPGATANFGAFSPDMIAANIGGAGLTSNTVCTGLTGDAQKLGYFSPDFGGFTLAVTYAPNAEAESQDDTGGPHVGMKHHDPGQSRHDTSVYATYDYAGDGWGLAAGGGAAFDGHVEGGGGATSSAGAAYQAALNLTFGSFAVGGAMEYWDDYGIVDGASLSHARGARTWIAGGGASYNVDAWTVGLQYSYGRSELATVDDGGTGDDVVQERLALTGIYNMGPGIDLDAELAYTWLNSQAPDDHAVDSYDALEIGLGTAFTF